MYLHGLTGLGEYQTIPNTSPAQCRAMGGTFHDYNAGSGNYTLQPVGDCTVFIQPPPPPPPSPAPVVTVSVPTSVQTQVSPSISPNLIQQQQPTNSGVSAGTASSPAQTVPSPNDMLIQQPQQTSPAPTQAAPAPDHSLQDFLTALQAQEAAQAADAAKASQSAQPAMQTSTVTYSPDTSSAPATVAPVVVPQENFFVKNLPYEMIAIAAVIGLVVMSSKKKRKGK